MGWSGASRDEENEEAYRVASHTGNLALMRNCVRRFLRAFVSERQRTLMVLGVDEACTNIIRHAYHLRDDQLISLSLESKSDCVVSPARLREKEAKPGNDRTAAADLIKPGGLGLHLIRNALIRSIIFAAARDGIKRCRQNLE